MNYHGNSYDLIAYNNCVLTHNIAYLSSLPIIQCQQIQIANDELRRENYLLKRNLSVCEIIINETTKKQKIVADAEFMPIQYAPIYFPIKSESWSEEKINLTISSIKSINDIIKLNNLWIHLRHNITLQKLYNLIPALIKLDKMIGLLDIKKDIFKKIIYYIQNPHDDEYLHTIISGPPGVGKTEFAKIYADICVRLGILKTNKFIEIKRDDLIGQYLGQTAPRTRELLESAMGGVLFLDEAYSLGNSEKKDSFSKEAIDMLNQYLSERKSEFMFIAAGYEEDLDSCFFAHNKGLRRRFHSHYKISGYKPKELREILIGKVANTQYSINIPSKELDNFFCENKEQFKNYGGDIEKLFNEIKQVQSLRTFNLNISNKDIDIEDIIIAQKNLQDKMTQQSQPPFGMYV